ncbi:MAG: aldo/keto reductase [Planctomycetota bacterium]|jgi:aryl-alcohol dehydrogenase-like predicted oxidoreductase
MDFKQHVPLGRTGLMVSRLGIASGYGVPAAAMEKAFHEHDVNYFYLSPILYQGRMRQALLNLVPRHRDKLVIVLAKPVGQGFFLRSFVERWLRKLDLDRADLVLLQDVRKHKPLLFERALKLKEEGKVRFVGISSHERPFFGRIARGEIDVPVDVFQLRYNAVHRGAERDIFPFLPARNRPGIVNYTATCWRKLLQAKRMPAGERPLSAAECYRFVLSNPHVDVCLTGPSTAERLEHNLEALEEGPLSEEERARVVRIGAHIYRPR